MSDEQYFKVTIREGEILAELRDGVHMSIRLQSATKAGVMLWQNNTIFAGDLGNLGSQSFREDLVKAARERFGADKVPHLSEDFEALAGYLLKPTATGKSQYDELAEIGERSVAVRMAAYARANASFFHDAEREAFAEVKVQDHTENYKLRSKTFRTWLRETFHENEKRLAEERAAAGEGALLEESTVPTPEVVREQTVSDVLSQFEALALFEGPEREVHVRVSSREVEGKIYLDLCDPAWRVVEISSSGWRVIGGHEAPVKFIRKAGMLPLPEPKAGTETAAGLEKLRRLLHLGERSPSLPSSAGSPLVWGLTLAERNLRLILTWMVHGLTPNGPYGVLTLLGNQGSGKSTAQRVIKSVTDPSVSPLRRKPREDRDLYIAATNGWVISLNNMSNIPLWLSEALCTLAEGGGLSIRKLCTDDEETLLDAMRPICLNGIGDVISRPDLLDRAVIVRVPDFPKKSEGEDSARKEVKKMDAELEAAKPEILAALLNGVCAYLKNRDDVERESISNDLRNVDFVVCGLATETALGGRPGDFMKAYRESRSEARDTALETWPVAQPVIELAKRHTALKPWEGTPSELLAKLNESVTNEDLKRAKDWPNQPNSLTAHLNRLVPDLAAIGVHVITGLRGTAGVRRIRVYFSKDG